jgi:hypothetical protein
MTKKNFCGKVKIIFSTLLFLLICLDKAVSADFYFGYSYGYSFALKEKRYDVNTWSGDPIGEYFSTPRMKDCRKFYIQFFPKNKKYGFTFAFFRQTYDKVEHWTLNNAEIGSSFYKTDFSYYILGVDYRFFANKDARLNPYLEAGLMKLFYLNLFGSGPPAYPSDIDLLFGGGMKLKIMRGLLINARMNCLATNLISSLLIGLELGL